MLCQQLAMPTHYSPLFQSKYLGWAVPGEPHQQPLFAVKLLLTPNLLKHCDILTVPLLPHISGVPRPYRFFTLLIEIQAHPHLLPILEPPLSISEAILSDPREDLEILEGARDACRGRNSLRLVRPLQKSSSRPCRRRNPLCTPGPCTLCRRSTARLSPSADPQPGRAHGSL